MKYNELQLSKSKSARRVGRGISAGRGKTAGRGTKGQKARAGSSAKPGFAGGTNPLMRKLPKLPGFKSYRAKVENVYTGQLNQFAGKIVDATALYEAGLVNSQFSTIKLIAKGDLTKKVSVKLPAASKAAVSSIEANGGSFEKVPRLQRQKTSKKTSK